MKRVAYLASRDTLPGDERRADAFEYDRMHDALVGPFAAAGLELVGVCWEDPVEGFDAALIGTTWDYWERLPEFLDALERIECPLFNPLETVRWNSNKRYLLDMPSPNTAYVEDPEQLADSRGTLDFFFRQFDCEKLVVKRMVGAGAFQQHLVERHGDWPTLDAPVLIQPFIASILTEGEISIIVVDGEISHAVRKRPKAGDYRIQSMYGGIETVHSPTDDEARLALRCVPDGMLYARVDLVYATENEPSLMELELIEPYLYPAQGPELGQRLATALAKRL